MNRTSHLLTLLPPICFLDRRAFCHSSDPVHVGSILPPIHPISLRTPVLDGLVLLHQAKLPGIPEAIVLEPIKIDKSLYYFCKSHAVELGIEPRHPLGWTPFQGARDASSRLYLIASISCYWFKINRCGYYHEDHLILCLILCRHSNIHCRMAITCFVEG